MLSPLWWLPLLVAALAAAALGRGIRRLLATSVALAASTEELRRLRPLVAQVRNEIAATAQATTRATAQATTRATTQATTRANQDLARR